MRVLVTIVVVVFASSLAHAVNIDLVTVGNPGNTGEPSGGGGWGPERTCGAVAYTFKMGKFEVTTGQYTEFLNAVAKTDTYGLYNEYMDYYAYPDQRGCNIKRTGSLGNYIYTVGNGNPTDVDNWANRPVNWVSYWDACRFTNWLTSSDTEDGSYTLNGYNGDDGRTIGRNPGARWFMPSEDEWYKAAYHKNDGVTGNYWDYPTGTDSMPGRDMSEATNPGNNANYYGNPYPIDSPYYTTVAGEFQLSDSPYGTFDQGGNVWEWNEAVRNDWGYQARGLGGGSFAFGAQDLRAVDRDNLAWPTYEVDSVGFRIAEVPEPATVILLLAGGVELLRRRSRR